MCSECTCSVMYRLLLIVKVVVLSDGERELNIFVAAICRLALSRSLFCSLTAQKKRWRDVFWVATRFEFFIHFNMFLFLSYE